MTKTITIPFNRPGIQGSEIEYMAQAVKNGHISGDGPFTHQCHQFLERTLGIHKALLTTSCTHALEMTALLLDIEPGDEVIVPAFTFVTTVNAFVLRGAVPVFIDVRSDTLNLDERLLQTKISQRTKAITLVHYAGVGCEMDTIMDIAGQNEIPVVEDNAHGLFGKYNGRYLGTFGTFATQSFHETKNVTCGEGGALLINDPAYIERAEIIREKGTNRSLFFRGQVDKYTWVDLGSSYLPSDMLAAYLYAQLEAYQTIQERRRTIWQRYQTRLSSWAQSQNIRLPFIPEHCQQSYHMFYLLLPDLESRQALISHLRERGILAVFHYLPLHLSKMGREFGGREGDCPISEDVSDRLLRLPFYNSIATSVQDQVIQAVLDFKV